MRLYCPTCSSLFLRANGNFVCWDAAGSDTVLQPYSESEDLAGIYYPDGPCFQAVASLRKGRLPRPETCPGCLCLTSGPSPVFRPSEVDVMQVEPSARCRLKCRGCASEEERERLKPPLDLTPEMFRKVLKDFSSAGIKISCFDFSGHGEPLMNPELPELISIARTFYSVSLIILFTNGQEDLDPVLLESSPDVVNVAIDGTDQESYVQYRVGGSFEKAYSFLESLAKAQVSGRSKVVWRYVLFNHNDEQERLASAWRMAKTAGADEIAFIFTSIGEWSRKVQNAAQLESMLKSEGVPEGSLRLSTQKKLRQRRAWGELFRRFPKIHHMARLLWRTARLEVTAESYPYVSADYCRIDPGQLREFLDLSMRHKRMGNEDGAEEIIRHVKELIAMPLEKNPSYDPEQFLDQLEEPYQSLISSVPSSGITE
ncbi:MAG: radical SAM protein [Candidatus Aegiribacteria sp.]|nr:radical SAM protein [Candidatus Aegiribacteria sp.]MBD3294804.1 radical SAM protein [Candidatus Fermentibacteria bacterium]